MLWECCKSGVVELRVYYSGFFGGRIKGVL